MKIKIKPSKAKGIVSAPPSKSMAHRLLICAGLAEGQSIISNIVLSEDIAATLDCLTVLGAKWEFDNNTVTITGIDLKKSKPTGKLPCRESGSTLRFFIPLAMVTGQEITLTGSERLFERPLSVYENIATDAGLLFVQKKNQVTVKGPLPAGEYSIPGNISSQFATGMLLALPLLDDSSKLLITGPVESIPYLNMTIETLQQFNIELKSNFNTINDNSKNNNKSVEQRLLDNQFTKPDLTQKSNVHFIENTSVKQNIFLEIKGPQKYTDRKLKVEGDYSNAAFLEAFNLFGGEVQVEGLAKQSKQGDKVYQDIFDLLAASTKDSANNTISLKDCPDLGPISFAVAAALNGGYFIDTKRLAIKESNRAMAMAKELKKFGSKVIVKEDSVRVIKHKLNTPTEILDGHNDHRIVMSLAVLASITGGIIDDAEAVAKSYPDFFETIGDLGIEYEIL